MEQLPQPCRALAVLLDALHWKANRLSAALKVEPSKVYDYLRGKSVPPRAFLEQAAVAMGLPARHVDRTLRYLRDTETAAARNLAVEQEIDWTADEIGCEWAEIHRTQMLRGWRLSQALLDRQAAAVLFPRLRACQPAERMALVQEKKEYQTWAIGELACHESIEATAVNADGALAWAGLAVLIAGLAEGDPVFLLRNEGYARFHLGNAIRVKGQSLPDADAEVCRASECWEAGAAGDPEKLLSEARVLGMQASLKRAQGDLPEAKVLLDRALALDCGTERIYLLINRATVLEKLGEHTEAIATLREALPLLASSRDARLALYLRFNILVNFEKQGAFAHAAQEIEEVRALALENGYEIGLAKLLWLQGALDLGMGKTAAAEVAFEQVRQEFLARTNHLEVALVSLELAVLYQDQGRRTAVQTIARELAPVFASQKVPEEAIAKLLLFRAAVEEDTLTAELARQLLEDFRRASGLAGARLEEPPGHHEFGSPRLSENRA